MSIETAFIVCAFGGLIIGGGVGEIAEKIKTKKKARRRAELRRLRRNSIESFLTAALYKPSDEKVNYIFEEIEVEI
jgi:hypothetical protein